jgi:anti-anti-sigma factor
MTSVDLEQLPSMGHVSWLVHDDEVYLKGAGVLLGAARERGDKTVLLGPKDSEPLTSLDSLADVAVDPRLEFLDGGPFRPERMLEMFGRELDAARRAGFAGLTVMADMDWLLPMAVTTAEIVAFELLLDRRVGEVGATVVCAYRSTSFDTAAIIGTRCVHPFEGGVAVAPPFRMVAADSGVWRLSGDIDVGVVELFKTVLGTVVRWASPPACVVDISEVEFIDAAGLRAIAQMASEGPIRLVGARPIVRRSWAVSRFGEEAPAVQLVS